MANTYDIGDLIRVSVTFRTLAGAVVDPTVVVVTVKDPSDNESTPTPVKESTGVYYADISLDEAGPWGYRWTGTGDAQGAVEHGFLVRDSVMDSP